MKNRIFRKALTIYVLSAFIAITFLSSISNKCSAQSQANTATYTMLIQQADQALIAKDYPEALFLYGKASHAKPEINYASSKIAEINTTLDANPDTRAQLFENIILKAESLYKQKNYPKAKAEYQKALLIDPSAQFPKDRLGQISAIYTDPEDIVYFSDAIASGDKALAVNEFDKAVLFYETALAVKPDAKIVKDKITNARKQQADYRLRVEQSAKNIASADKLLLAGKRADARAEYQKASELTPDNQYAKQKIQEIDKYTGDKKVLQDSYDKVIEQADQFYINRDFASARLKYQEALKAKPEARYPKEMLEKTKSGESQVQSDQQKYDAALASAENLLKSADYEAALIGFKSALAIKPSENYPKIKITEIEKLITGLTSRKEAFDIAVKNGDQAQIEKKYDIALSHYRNALSLLPGEKYPAQKIDEITAITGQQKSLDEDYKKSIATADRHFSQNKFEDAIAAYTQALGYKPDENYPQQKINEAKSLIATMKITDENYASAIAKGDRLMSEFKYNEAFEAFELARSKNSFSEYPIGKMAEINFLFSKYTKAIEKGDKAVSLGNFDLAIKFYQDALTIKPTDQPTQDKINGIKATVETQQKTDEKYLTAINTGDQLFAAKDYNGAIVAYNEAAGLKKNEKYPQDQIIKTNKILGELHSADENYNLAIVEGDNYFKNQKLNEAVSSYRKASAIKPSEKYPSEKITELEKLISGIKNLQESYSKALADGDKSFSEKEYTNSLAFFKSAKVLKPGEAYPNQKITEIQAIIDQDKLHDQQYADAITQADIYFKDKKYSEALESYQHASTIKPTEKYPQDQAVQINQLHAGLQKLDDDFLATVTTADQFFEGKKYAAAIVDYRKALVLKPSEKYPADKIAESEKQIADLKTMQDTYDKAIAEGDKKLAEKDYISALASFKSANSARPAELYPPQKITEIQSVLDKNKAENDRYTEAIALADKFYSAEKYREALEPYQRASTIKSLEKYPLEQITRINQLLAEQEKLDNNYQKLITDAALQLEAGKLEEARVLFTKASTLKPAEKLPKEKLEEISKKLAELKFKEENYAKAINIATELYNQKNLAGAIKSYEAALAIKPAEKYPQERIASLKSEILAINESYSKAITLGDSKIASQSLMDALNAYQNALEIKPNEEYPKSKITEINTALAAQKEELEKMYNSYISAGDKLSASKDYVGARSEFTKATGMKPAETYPKQRIIEINKIVEEIELARRVEYTKALGEADKLYNTKIFDQAIDAYEAAALINPGDSYPALQISKIKKYMVDHAIQDLYSQTLLIIEGNEKKFNFSAIEPRLRKNNYILLKARSTGKTAPKVYLNYGKDNQKNGGIVLRSLDKTTINDYLIRISGQDKWYREDNNWISLFVETGDIEITKVQIAAGDE